MRAVRLPTNNELSKLNTDRKMTPFQDWIANILFIHGKDLKSALLQIGQNVFAFEALSKEPIPIIDEDEVRADLETYGRVLTCAEVAIVISKNVALVGRSR